MNLSHRQLYVLAIFIWLIAGANVLAIGLRTWPISSATLYGKLLWLAGALVFFSGFIFPRVVKRNINFVQQLPAHQNKLYNCFAPASWVVIIVMISLGIFVRHLLGENNAFVPGFYTGLGCSLILAIRFYLPLIRKG